MDFRRSKEMKLIDWGDTLMHGIPWVLLIYFTLVEMGYSLKKKG